MTTNEAHSTHSGDTRREFLGKAGLAAAATGVVAAGLAKPAQARPPAGGRDVLVVLYMRGGMDGVSICVPYGDAELYNRRPTIAIKPPGQTDGATNLDGFFGLAPAALPLLAPYNAGQLLFVHAVGSTDPSRSHFDAQKFMEQGNPNQPGPIATGWAARHLASTVPAGSGLLRGVALDYMLPRALAGAPATLPIADLADFRMPGAGATNLARRRTLSAMFHQQGGELGATTVKTFQAIDLLGSVSFSGYVPANGASYPLSLWGDRLASVAALIKADLGVEVIEVDLHGWDKHSNIGSISGEQAHLSNQLAQGLNALWTDLGVQNNRVTTLVMSEFGRRADENGNLGVDHGHGGMMMLMGGNVTGGRVFSQWPGMGLPQLDNGDLAITTDYRNVIAEVAFKRLGNANLGALFPNHSPNFHGLVL
ncbi:MAG: DUF1501 domain-containing protein [Planctomycetota bacterium]|nr:DUF1501 domain-containing protein [Planctomycetota bacterium]